MYGLEMIHVFHLWEAIDTIGLVQLGFFSESRWRSPHLFDNPIPITLFACYEGVRHSVEGGVARFDPGTGTEK